MTPWRVAGITFSFRRLVSLLCVLGLFRLAIGFLGRLFRFGVFFLSFLSEDLESAEAAADFFSGEDFLSFKSLLAFEASSFLLFFSLLATLTTSRNVPVLAPGLCE